MNDKKQSILALITGLSLATINVLAKNIESGIGSNEVVDAESINTLHDIRKTIISENVALRLRDIPNIELREGSILRTFSDENVRDGNFGNLPSTLADIITGEFNVVKNEIIPMINSMADRIQSNVSTIAESKSSLRDEYNIRIFIEHPIIKLLLENDIANNPINKSPDLSGLGFKLPPINDLTLVKEVIQTNSVVANDAISRFLSTRTDTQWINMFNDMFTNLIPGGSRLMQDMLGFKVYNLDLAIFTFLIVRNIEKMYEVIEGSPEDFRRTMNILSDFASYIISDGMALYRADTNNGIVVLYNKDNNILINGPLAGDLDIDGVIGAALEGKRTLNEIAPNIVNFRESFDKADELYHIEKSNRVGNLIKAAIMSEVDATLPGIYPEFTPSLRLSISNKVYDEADISKLLNIKQMLYKIILHIPSLQATNSKFILRRMTDYIARYNKTSEDFSCVAEYVALELVSRYLVNTHVIAVDPVEDDSFASSMIITDE